MLKLQPVKSQVITGTEQDLTINLIEKDQAKLIKQMSQLEDRFIVQSSIADK